MKTPLIRTPLVFLFLLALAGCTSPNTGTLVVNGDDDDAVGDDDDAVGDDDDAVGDDDDAVGASPFAGTWEGEVILSRPGGGGGGGGEFEICNSDASFEVTDTGEVYGIGECEFGGGGGGGADGFIEFNGALNEGGELGQGEAHMQFGDFIDEEYVLEGGIYEEGGTNYLYMWFEAEFEGGRGSFQVFGEGWGVLK